MTLRSQLVALGTSLAVVIAVTELGAEAGGTDVFFEQEPNDFTPELLDMGPGAQPGEPVSFRIKGRIDPAVDVDRFQLQLNAGIMNAMTEKSPVRETE